MLGCAAVGCSCASVVVCIISIALPFWIYYQPPLASEKYYYGLWTLCGETASTGKICTSITTGLFIPVRTLEIIGLILAAGAVLTGCISLCAMKENRRLALAAKGLSSSAGACMISGAIVFGVKSGDLHLAGATLHAGFGLAIVSGVIAFIGSGLFYFATKTNSTLTQANHKP